MIDRVMDRRDLHNAFVLNRSVDMTHDVYTTGWTNPEKGIRISQTCAQWHISFHCGIHVYLAFNLIYEWMRPRIHFYEPINEFMINDISVKIALILTPAKHPSQSIKTSNKLKLQRTATIGIIVNALLTKHVNGGHSLWCLYLACCWYNTMQL